MGYKAVLCGVGVAIVGLVPSAAAAAPTDPFDPASVDLMLVATGPPSIADGLEFVVELVGGEIAEGACVDRGLPAPHDTGPTLACTDLADGNYTVSVTGAPADAAVRWECLEGLTTPVSNDPIVISADDDFIACEVVVTRPGVVLSVDHIDSEAVTPEALAVYDADGVVVESDCETDDRGFGERGWCTGLENGVYTVVPVGVPEGFRAAVICEPKSSFITLPADPPDLPDRAQHEIVIDDDHVLWGCSGSQVFAPLRFSLRWSAQVGQDIGWVGSVTASVTNAAGLDVSDQCTLVGRNDTDRGGGGVDGGPYINVAYRCLGIEDGEYTVAFDGIPGAYATDSSCEPVLVGFMATCSVEVDSIVAPATTVAPPTTMPSPTALLPATGASQNLAVPAVVSLLLGVGLVGLTRRRLGPPTG